MSNVSKESWLSAARIHKILNVYLWLYGVAIVISLIYVLLSALLLLLGQSVSLLNIVFKIISSLWLAALFFGIFHMKSWVPITITILSAFGFLSVLSLMLGAHTPSFHSHAIELIYYWLLPLGGFWQLFTLYFFNTKEVKSYFQTSGFTIIKYISSNIVPDGQLKVVPRVQRLDPPPFR